MIFSIFNPPDQVSDPHSHHWGDFASRVIRGERPARMAGRRGGAPDGWSERRENPGGEGCGEMEVSRGFCPHRNPALELPASGFVQP